MEIFNQRIEILNEMIKKNKIPKGVYAFRLAAATNENYRGKGLNKKCLDQLRDIAKNKYDFFVGVMDYDNICFHAHRSSLKNGMEAFWRRRDWIISNYRYHRRKK